MTRMGLHGAGAMVAAVLLSCGAAGAAAEGSLNPMARLDRAALADFVQRPLFDPTRRLPPEVPPPVQVETRPVVASIEPPPALHLLGVIHGRRDMAVVHRDDGDKTVILRTGDEVNGWIVTVRPPNTVTLKSGTRTSDYALFSGAIAGIEPIGVAARTDTPGAGTKVSETRTAAVQERRR